MTLPLMVRKSLRQHLLSTLITAFSIALAGGLLMSVWVVKDQSQTAFTGVNAGFDAVLGARGSKLQLVLNTIFHLEESPGNIPASDYHEIRANPAVQVAIPIALGDNYLGYRVVGTTTNLFTDVEHTPGRRFDLAAGRVFDPGLREAVVGSFVATRLGMKVGDRFQPYHGLIFNPDDQHAESYVVVGVMRPSNTPADRVVWIPLAGVQLMAGHDPKAASDLSGVLVKFKSTSLLTARQLELLYNKQGNRLTFAWPIAQIVSQLFNKIAWVDRVLALVAYLVALVAAGSILVSIYNTMKERRRDIAILRALGARRGTLFAAIILEAMAIAALGMVFAFGVYLAILTGVAAVVRAQTGVVLEPWVLHPVMALAPLGMIGLAALSGLLPAWKAYQTPVAENLVPQS
ncbi:MAG: ABC transporter permease [Verrucomicrobiales bacterium]|nr:ABC transporter permease [Verrucomicrobiales bacterium]